MREGGSERRAGEGESREREGNNNNVYYEYTRLLQKHVYINCLQLL